MEIFADPYRSNSVRCFLGAYSEKTIGFGDSVIGFNGSVWISRCYDDFRELPTRTCARIL